MTETKKQIEQLKKALPGLKEKVFGVAVLLCISLVMVASVSYAWVTMSTNPELGGVNTTVAANGALEIALSDFDGKEPEQSAVGDSFAAEGQTTHAANTSWGNLVNISNGYGVESLILRPAALDLQSDVYLYGAKYSQDGRVEGSLSNFGFTTWYQTDKTTNTWAFIAPSQYPSVYPNGNAYGVRAISSVAYEGQENANTKKIENLANMQRQARNHYYDLTTDEDNVEVIRALVQVYLDKNVDAAISHVLGGGDGAFVVPDFSLDGKTYIPPLTNMLNDFYSNAICSAGDSLVYAANLQMEAWYNNLEVKEGQTKPEMPSNYTLETLLAVQDSARNDELLAKGIKLTALGYNASTKKYSDANAFKNLHDKVKADVEIMKTFWEANGEAKKSIKWSELEPIVNNLIHINSLKVQGKTINQIASMGTGALSFVNNMPQRASVVVYQGSLWSFEDLTGEFMSMDIPVKVYKKVLGIGVDYNGIGVVTTSVPRNKDCRLVKDAETVKVAVNAVDTRTIVAKDTYGMILDLWIRTNGENSLLTLNGTPKYEKREEQRVIIINGETYDVYAYNRYTGDKMQEIPLVGKVPETKEILVYPGTYTDETTGQTINCFLDCATSEVITRYDIKNVTEVKDDKGNVIEVTYDVVDSGEPLTADDMNTYQNEKMVQAKIDVYQDVVGYESANRIWKDDDVTNNPPALMPGEISTTQGSGSCYIFYADSHEESARALELLANLRLVFLDEEGRELSRAFLDVEHVYAESGKYTVPIAISQTIHSITDPVTGAETLGICKLTKNVATRISVLVYLDGAQLKNEMVMSAEDIIGSLNLQFDSTADLRSIGDSDLSMDVISLDADLLQNGSETVQELSFEYDGNPVTVPVRATVEGLLPTKVEVAFQRKVSATQGSRMDIVTLQDDDGDGRWEANVTFKAPGTYILKTVLVDGIEYALPETLTVEIEGFAVDTVLFDTSAAMTTDYNVSREVSVTLAADLLAMPSKVQARFMTEDGRSINADLVQTGNTWSGSANFIKSGTYTLQYLVMDGEYYELPLSLQRTFIAYLGLTADVVLERYKIDDNGNYVLDDEGNKIIDTLEYPFTRAENIHAFVQVYDDTGTLMKALGNIELTYKPAGSSIMSNGFSTGPMTWNGTEYVGTFLASSPGLFEFGQLKVGNQYITTARKAPTMSIISLTPPAFRRTESPAIILGQGTVYYQAYITDAQTAGRWVVLNDGTADHVVKLETTALPDVYQAALPDLDGNKDNAINSNGTWTVKEMRFDNVYADGQFHPTGEEPYVINLESKNQTFTVVNYLTVETTSLLLGATANEEGKITSVTGQFMDAYNMKDYLSVTVKAPIKTSNPTASTACVDPGVYAAQLTVTSKLTYGNDSNVFITDANGNSIAYGGYTGGTVNAVDLTFIENADLRDANSVTFVITDANNKVLRNAGTYDGTTTVTLSSKVFEPVQVTDQVKIFSNRPTVKISAISSNAASDRYYLSSKPTSLNVITGSYNWKSTDGLSAAVYMYVVAQGGSLDQEQVAIKYPTVTLSMSGVPTTHQGATMVFGNATDSTKSSTFSFAAGSTTAKASIGAGTDGSYSEGLLGIGAKVEKWPEFYPAGKQTVRQIQIKMGDNTYTVELIDGITINNPQCPQSVSIPKIVSTDSSFKGTDVSTTTFYSQNAETVTLTLPDANAVTVTWTKDYEFSSGGGDFVATGKTETAMVHTTASASLGRTTYKQYQQTITEYQKVTTKTNRTDTHTITGWKVGNVVYALGETVTLPVGSKVIPVISVVKGAETGTTATATKYYVTFTATGKSESKWGGAPSGYGSKVTSVSAYWTEETFS